MPRGEPTYSANWDSINMQAFAPATRSRSERRHSKRIHHRPSTLMMPGRDSPISALVPSHIVITLQSEQFQASLSQTERKACTRTIAGEWPKEKIPGIESKMAWSLLLKADLHAQGLRIGRSLVKGGGNGLFTTRSFKKGIVLGWYHGYIVFKSRGRLPRRSRTHSIAVRMDDDEQIHIIPNGACAMAFLNDPRPSPQEKQFVNVSLRSKNILIKDDDLREMDDPFRLSCIASRDVAIGEELYVDYGTRYF
jgi:hypothetical protein